MPRYAASSRVRSSVWWEDQTTPPLGHPISYDQGPQDTGLVDCEGHPILRLPDQIGFVRDKTDDR